MILRSLAIASFVLLISCSSTKPAPEIPLDDAVPATIQAEPAPPVEIVTIPQLMPLPGQLKRLPEESRTDPPTNPNPAAAQGSVNQANSAARVEPTFAGFINAMQVWPYSPAALYQVYASPGQVTDIVLQAGEQLTDVSVSDPVRWVIGDTKSGTGESEQIHLIVKPTRGGLKANLVITTDRRTYYLELRSETDTWMAAISWDYPHDRLVALKIANQQRESLMPVATGVQLEHLKFRYEISGDKPSWRPVRAFDDGAKVYIQFPDAIAHGEMPPLFVIGPVGDTQIVNYRVRSPYYIVDRLFGAAELRLGGKKSQVVRITRNDVKKGQAKADAP
jgi:P-type conjugative transfer protein TrbG